MDVPDEESPPDDQLRRRVVNAGLWAFALQFTGQALIAVRTIAIARLLAPDDVGLFGIALLSIATLETVTEPGFREALIQRERWLDDYLPTVWTLQVVRNGLIALALVLAAPSIAGFFGEPNAMPMLQAVALAVIVSGFENVAVVRFEKELEFDRHFYLNVAGVATDLVCSVAAALILRNAWALILGLLAGRLARTAVSYVLTSYRPTWGFDRALLRELFGYGRWVFASRVVNFLALKGDDILVGRLLGAFALGIYQVAFQIGEIATRQLTTVIANVTFPAYSSIQSDTARIRRGFLFTLQGVASIVLPVAVVTAFVADPFVRVVLGTAWAPVATVLPLLVFSASVRGLVATAGGVYLALGQPRLSLQVSLMRVVVLFALILPLALRYGLMGVAMAVFASTLTTIPFALVYVRRLLHAPMRDIGLRALPGAALACAVMVPFAAFRVAGWTGPGATAGAAGLALGAYGLIAFVQNAAWSAGPLPLLALLRPRGRDQLRFGSAERR